VPYRLKAGLTTTSWEQSLWLREVYHQNVPLKECNAFSLLLGQSRWRRQSQDKSAMIGSAPTTPNRTLPRRQPNAAYRQREYLTEKEVERLIEAVRKRGRNSARDGAAILLAYRHGLRAQELCQLRWAQIDLPWTITR
jgi:integrase